MPSLKTVRVLGTKLYSALLATLLMTVVLALPAHAQVDSGKVIGQVQDSSGAVVKGA